MSEPELGPRSYWGFDDDRYLNVGDKPWYCFWNSSVSEFWVFLDQDMDLPGPLDNGSTTITSQRSSPTSATHSTSFTSGPQHGSTATSQSSSGITPAPTQPTNEAYWTGSRKKVKRQASVGSPSFPKLAKMVEKRKPDNNVPPYCQQMQVLNNWQIMPIPTVPTICIEESNYIQATSTGSSRMARRKRDSSTVQELSSNCLCEYFSI